eukprot:GILJ01002080.1.p1 GENE.GILJ01002080.1~~GILJ01002080.1.p1  ORF type:complete len:125 (+),score=30.98 GILJ01002080.1:49-423(+)
MQALSEKLESCANEMRKIQREMQKLASSKATYISQNNENQMVKEEFDRLEEDATVYKLVGPLLVKQEVVEAKGNVSKRLEFITGEIARLDNASQEFEKKLGEKQEEMMRIQQEFQALRAKATKS